MQSVASHTEARAELGKYALLLAVVAAMLLFNLAAPRLEIRPGSLLTETIQWILAATVALTG